MLGWLWVAAGGAVGSLLRYQVAGAVQRWNGSDWPLGTLAVNLAGSLVIGGITHLVLARGMFSAEARLFVMVGLLGGFTTFSTFSIETLRLLQQGAWEYALANAALSVAGGLAAAWAGFALIALLWP